MKLTKGEFTTIYTRGGLETVWNAIESHTTECVAEAVANCIRLPKDVWKDAPAGAKGISVRFVDYEEPYFDDLVAAWNVLYIPNPTRKETRPLTDAELYMKLIEAPSKDLKLSRPTLEAMAADLGIKTEVSE